MVDKKIGDPWDTSRPTRSIRKTFRLILGRINFFDFEKIFQPFFLVFWPIFDVSGRFQVQKIKKVRILCSFLTHNKTMDHRLALDWTPNINHIGFYVAKEKGFYLGWSEFYSKYRTLFPTLMNVEPITLFNHKIWETQIDSFEHGITLSYESFKDNPKFVNKKNRDEKFITLKQTDSNSNSDDFYLKYSKQKEIFEKKK